MIERTASRAVEIRPRRSLYHAEGGWFSANWHFSFDRYQDGTQVGWGDLRVFNDDRLVPGAAWPLHPHRDIEGVTYVAEGTFEHADSQGNGGVLLAGSVQRVTLGSGLWHSERNGSTTEPLRFIQLWIMPSRRGLEPSVEQRSFSEASRRDLLRPVLVPAPGYGGAGAPRAEGALTVHQDAAMYAGLLSPGATVTHRLRDGFGGYLFVVHGDAALDGAAIDEGGAAKIGLVGAIAVDAGPSGAELLLVETRLG
ncbi:MAG: pirin family protein [Candidatus Limnocylindria bacterium]